MKYQKLLIVGLLVMVASVACGKFSPGDTAYADGYKGNVVLVSTFSTCKILNGEKVSVDATYLVRIGSSNKPQKLSVTSLEGNCQGEAMASNFTKTP